jgi:hypothetical protein
MPQSLAKRVSRTAGGAVLTTLASNVCSSDRRDRSVHKLIGRDERTRNLNAFTTADEAPFGRVESYWSELGVAGRSFDGDRVSRDRGCCRVDGPLAWDEQSDTIGDAVSGAMAATAVRQLASASVLSDVARTPHSAFRRPQSDMTRAIIIGSSSASQMSFYLGPALAAYGITLHNGGVGGERIRWTEARIGSDPLVLTFPGIEIPASGTINVTMEGARPPGTLNAIAGRVFGVAGTVTVVAGSVTWTRTTEGPAVRLPGAVPHIPDLGRRGVTRS